MATMVCVVPTQGDLIDAAAVCIASTAREAVRRRGRCLIALSGGRTAAALYARLATAPFRRAIPWTRLHIFWGDERFVPAAHAASNVRLARTRLLSRVPIPPQHVHPVPVECATPQAAAAAYERAIRRVAPGRAIPAFDLVLLGLGEDGHTASLFPRSAAVRARRRLVAAAVGGAPRLPRVTFTLPLVNQARRILWLVSGLRKSAIVGRVLDGPFHPRRLPAQGVRPRRGDVIWLLDRAAAHG